MDMIEKPPYSLTMTTECLFEHQSGLDRRKERALQMISEGHTHAEVCLQLQASNKTLTKWIKSGLSTGDPDLDQVSLVDGLSERERQS